MDVDDHRPVVEIRVAAAKPAATRDDQVEQDQTGLLIRLEELGRPLPGAG